MSSSNSPCAACKLLRRKCAQECIFAPYFPSDDPRKFVSVHKVFGASNVAKLLNELNVAQRKDAVESLAYEAEARLRDPVYGCVGLISVLQHKLRQVQSDLFNAKKELATCIGPQAMLPLIQPTHAFMPQQNLGNPSSSSNNLMNAMNVPMMGIPTVQTHGGAPLVIREPKHQQQQQQPHPQQQHQMYEAEQLAAVVAAREQEMLRVYEAQKLQQRHHQQQQQHQELIGFNHSGFEGGAASVTATGFNQMNAAAMSPSLALGTFDNQYQIQPQQQEHQHHPLQEQLLFQTQQPPQTQQQPPQQTLKPPQQQRSGSDEDRSGVLP